MAEAADLDKAELTGKEDTGAQEQDDGQRKIPQDRYGAVPGKIGRKVPEQVGDGLDPGTDRVYSVKQCLHMQFLSFFKYFKYTMVRGRLQQKAAISRIWGQRIELPNR